MISANGDIMIRTLLLVFSFAWFTNLSAQFGTIPLAANYLLLQLIAFCAFFLDGYAFVLESLIGRAIGAKNAVMFNRAVARSTGLALLTAIVLAALLYLFGSAVIALLTDLTAVRQAANELRYLAALYVLLAFGAFQLDGIFIGAAATGQMRNAAAISTALFLLFCGLLLEPMGIVGLWWAFIAYVCVRAGALLIYYPALRRSLVSSVSPQRAGEGSGS
jgi:MATE family multidrug resistance protein